MLSSYDIITMWHVLEHVHLLNETIDWLSEHLTPNGKIIIAVPNPQSPDAAKYSGSGLHTTFRGTLSFHKRFNGFTDEKSGFQVDTIHPMWFDSFYVSMLSTKYKMEKLIFLTV